MACDLTLDPDINFSDPTKKCNCKYLEESQLEFFFRFNERDGVNLLHANCRRLNKKFTALTNLLHFVSNNLTAIKLTETLLTSETKDYFNIDGYNFVTNSRTNRKNEGVGILVYNCSCISCML